MVHDGHAETELRVLDEERIEPVRAGRDYSLERVFLERLDVRLDEGLGEIFVPHPARRLPAAHLLGPEDREIDARLLHERHEGARDLLTALIERAGAADPEEHVEAPLLRGERHREIRRPVGARRIPDRPRDCS